MAAPLNVTASQPPFSPEEILATGLFLAITEHQDDCAACRIALKPLVEDVPDNQMVAAARTAQQGICPVGAGLFVDFTAAMKAAWGDRE